MIPTPAIYSRCRTSAWNGSTTTTRPVPPSGKSGPGCSTRCWRNAEKTAGSNRPFTPHCTLATANHPILPALREKGYQYNLPIHIGRNCWLGSGVIVVPGVTIGDNTVIGAGSVVTKDIPANVVAVGSPCRVLRPISDHDREYFYRDRKIDWDHLGL